MSISVKRPLNSVYIHVPFCKDKCYYCAFVSLVDKNKYVDSYIHSLINELEGSLKNHKGVAVKSIYIGGGTPSLLKVECYKKIMSKLHEFLSIDNNIEKTIEINPGTVDYSYLKNLRGIGINRLSIGIQSFDNDILKLLNRKHDSKQAIHAVELAHDAGFENISIDLIYSLPNQDLKLWKKTLNIAANLDIQHISAYGLKIEPETKFDKNLPPNLPDEELSAQMYLDTIEILKKSGFIHYEISNFAKKGFESRHNLGYWHNEEYFGFGLAAHGYVDGVRYANTCNFDEYLNDPFIKASSHKVTYQEAIEEGIFLGLRLTEGINIRKFNEEYHCNLIEKHGRVIDKYLESGHMEIKNGNLRLTTEGILVSNVILADFLD